MEIDVSVTQFDTRTGHIHFFFVSPRNNNSSKQMLRCVVCHTVLFHIFHNQIHHERNIAVLCTFIFIQCEWTCDVRVRVYILSLSFSFIVQITYECYEVLKLKSLHNMVTVGKCLGYIWKGFVRYERKTRYQENSLLEFSYDAIRSGRKNCQFDGG